jgi:hypothetical protein
MKSRLLEELHKNIQKFYRLQMPDQTLSEWILTSLGIYDIVELGFCMNRYQKSERDAAMRMVEKYIEDLTSDESDRSQKAKKELTEIYHTIVSSDEEAIL